MKKLLMITAALLAFAVPAQADQLPAIYLGQWCANADESYSAKTPEKECEATSLLTIKQDELAEHESGCRFRSIKKTKDLRPNSTKPTKADWTPVMEVLAHCDGAGFTSVVRMWLIYQKGALSIKSKTLREKPAG